MTHLTSSDVAPVRSALATGEFEAVPGHACVFAMQLADGLHDSGTRLAGCAAPSTRIAFGP